MNCLLNNTNMANYEQRFKDILSFDKRSSLWEIVELKGADYPGFEIRNERSSFYWIPSILGKTFVGNNDQFKATLNAQALKTLRQRIKVWNSILENEREEALYKPGKLIALQSIAKKIFSNNKTSSLIRNKLSEMQLEDKKLEKALARFDEMVDRILTSIPLQATRSESPVSSSHTISIRSASILMPKFNMLPLLEYKPRIVLSQSEIDDISAESTEKRSEQAKKRVIHNFSSMNKNDDPSWQQHLAEAFQSLNNSDEIKALGPILTLEQVVHILAHCFAEKENAWKLPFFIGSIPFNRLAKALLRDLAQPELLQSLNDILCKIDGASREWLDKAFCVLILDFILINTRKKDEIDELNREFRLRLELEPEKITFDDICKIGRLERNIHKHWQALKNLRILMNRVLTDPETIRCALRIGQGVSTLLKRLNDEGPHLEGDENHSINFTAKMMPTDPNPKQISAGVESYL